MAVSVYSTNLADVQIGRLRNKGRDSFVRFVPDLEHRGCAAMGYRLTGPEPISVICVKHLVGNLRVVVAFETICKAWIVMIGPHDRESPRTDVYRLLYELAGVRPPDDAKRTKPPCCDEVSGAPAELTEELDQLVARARSRRG